MEHVLLVIHLILTLAMIGLILLQRSEGGGLGIGGGGGGLGSFASAQSTANVLTKATQITAAGFFATSLILAILASHRGAPTSILDSATTTPAAISKEVPVTSKDVPTKAPPTVPIGP
jgi:preprotein translocase subunit SecG